MKFIVPVILGIWLGTCPPSQGQVLEPLLLETRVVGEVKDPVKASVPLVPSDFGSGEKGFDVKVMMGAARLPSQYDPVVGTLTVVLSPAAVSSNEAIKVFPVVGDPEKPPVPGDAVTLVEKEGVVTIANGKFTVRHDPDKMAGLPSSIQLQGGVEWNRFRMGDRLFRKEPQPASYFLMHDKEPKIEILKRGPFEVALRVTARYLDEKGEAPQSKPTASYLFTYDQSPLVKIHVEVRQESPVFWNEKHIVELGFSHNEFDHWMTSRETAFAALLHQGKMGKPRAPWSALAADDGGVIALQSDEHTTLFDGEGTISHYLHGPWRSWAGLHDSADLTLALIPTETAPPSGGLTTELTGLMARSRPPLRAWLTTPTIQAFQKTADPSPRHRHIAWLMEHRVALFPSLAARRKVVENILAQSADIAVSGKELGIPGLMLLGDQRQSIAIRQTADGIGVVSVLASKPGVGFLAPDLSPIWTLEFRFPGEEKGPESRVFDSLNAWASVKVEPIADGLRLVWEGAKDWPEGKLRVVGSVRLKEGRSEWDLKVENGSDSMLHEVGFPQWELASLTEGGDLGQLMMPRASGVLVPNPVDAKVGIDLSYPSAVATMQCFAHYSDRAGLYLATHDPDGTSKNIKVNSRPSRRSVTLDTRVPVPNNSIAGNDWQSPAPAVLQVFDGDWFDASQIYREWAEAEASWWPGQEKKTPQWFREISAWALASGAADQVVPRVKKFAEYMEVPTALHWYTWHRHPFDDNYPEYFPARPGTAEGLKEMQTAGIRVTPYINGLIWDKSRQDFQNHALPAATKRADGQTYTSVFGSKVEFAPMCPTTAIWREKMTEVVGRLADPEFGFDGVYLDQIASAKPVECYDVGHGHPLGGGHWWHEDGYWPLLEKVRAQAGKHRPDWVLTSEANAETYVNHSDGLLTWHFQNDGQIPLFAAVYGGQVQLFGRAYRKDAWKGIAMRAHTAQALVFGEQLGWITPAVVDDPVAGPFLKQLAKLRYEFRDHLADGRMLRPPKPIGQLPEVTTNWPWYSGDGKVTLSGVQSGAWQAKGGSKVLLFVNILDEPVNFEVNYPLDSLGKRAIELAPRQAIAVKIE